MSQLSEDESDDVLYCARANELQEMKDYLRSLLSKYQNCSEIVSQAVDAHTGNTALHYACANGHLDTAQYLLSVFTPASAELKAFINRQNQSSNTPLHWAALNGHMEIVKLLLTTGADASILNASGHDAVFEAEMNDKQEVGEYLLKEALGLEQVIGGDDEDADGDDGMVVGGPSSLETDAVANGMDKMDISSPGAKDDSK